MEADDNALLEQIIEIVEEALRAAGYMALKSDVDASCIVSPEGIHFDVKLRMRD